MTSLNSMDTSQRSIPYSGTQRPHSRASHLGDGARHKPFVRSESVSEVGELLRQQTPMGRPISSSNRHSAPSFPPPKSASSFLLIPGHDAAADFVEADFCDGDAFSPARDSRLTSATELAEQRPQYDRESTLSERRSVLQRRACASADGLSEAFDVLHSGSLSGVATKKGGTIKDLLQRSTNRSGPPLPALRRVHPHAMHVPGRGAHGADIISASVHRSTWGFSHKAGLAL
jgi:hypothetical protein